MKNKFKFLTKDSIKKKVSTKSFKITNLVLLIIIVALTNLDSIVKFFGGDFDEVVHVYVVDEVGVYDEFKKTVDNSFLNILDNYNASIEKSSDSVDDLKKEIIDKESSDIIINITNIDNPTYEKMFNVDFISYDYVDTVLYQNILTALNSTKVNLAMKKANIDQEILDKVNAGVEVNRILLDENLNENEELMEKIGSIITIAFILPFFILIVLIVQMIGAEINEEKSTKSMEVIISSVSPEVHFISKLISANVFAILQGLLLILYTVIGGVIRVLTTGGLAQSVNGIGELNSVSQYINLFIKSDIASRLVNGIPFFVLLIILSFVAYSLLIGILASVTTSMEDYNQIQTPVMIFLMVGYYLAIIASIYQGATFIKVMSLIPFISGILAPVTYTLGEIELWHMGVSIGLLLLVCYLLYKYGIKVYKAGILNYSSSKLWTKIFKSLKDKEV